MRVLGVFPVLAIVVAFYNVLFVFGSRAVGVLTSVTFPSGDIWPVTVGDTIIVTALALVVIELASVGTGRVAVVNHALSALVFIICLIELFFVRGCGTPEFTILTLIVGLDVLAGYSLTARLARRNLDFAPVRPN
jgi:hypothetical protein